MTGKFISFDGADGAGKSTQLRLLSDCLAAQGIKHIVTREPGGSLIAEKLREILLNDTMHSDTEMMLMCTARKDHVETVIKPALAQGTWVLCDRFVDSTYAYQGGGRGLSMERIKSLHDWAIGDFMPHITLMFDVPPEVTQSRLTARANLDKFETEKQQFFLAVRQTFLDIACADTTGRVKLIDATHSVATVHAEVMAYVKILISMSIFTTETSRIQYVQN